MHKRPSKIVSITSQGQLTIPKSIRKAFGIKAGAKAVIRKERGAIIVEPKKDFWTLAGSLRSKIKLSDAELKAARKAFSEKWARYE